MEMYYKYKGASAMVVLHDRHMKSLLGVWLEAKSRNVPLPDTEDKDYVSLDSLHRHIFRASRGYMIWMCDKLDLPDPEIKAVPDADVISQEAEGYLEYLLDKWRTPLAGIEESRYFSPTYTSRWGVEYCIESMLEHAVLHPIRHEYQLRNLIDSQ